MKKKLTIKQLFNISVCMLVIMGVLIYIIFSIFVFNPMFEEGNRETDNLISSVKDNLDSNFKFTTKLSASIAYDTTIQNFLLQSDRLELYKEFDNATKIARYYCENNSEVVQVLITNKYGGMYTLYSTNEFSFMTSKLSVDDFEINDITFIPYAKSDNVDYYCYARNVAMTEIGENYRKELGTLYVLCKTSSMQAMLDNLSFSKEGYVAVVNKHNSIVLSSTDNVGEKLDVNDASLRADSLVDDSLKIVMPSTLESVYIKNINTMFRVTISMFALFFGMIIFVYYLFKKKIIKPIADITVQMENIGYQSLKSRIDVNADMEIAIIVDGINNMLGRLETMTKRIVGNQQKLYEMEILNQESMLTALQNQVNPHFLYNTLECMRSIALSYSCKEVSVICVSLSKIFRYSVQGGSMVTVGEELAIVKEYMKIINIRFSDKITIDYDIEEGIEQKACHKMFLQPIVENSIKHGIEKITGQGMLKISAHSKDGKMIFKVSDNGCGMDEAKVEELENRLAQERLDEAKHIGIYNVNKRIQLQYGNEYGISIKSKPDFGTTVTIVIPNI